MSNNDWSIKSIFLQIPSNSFPIFETYSWLMTFTLLFFRKMQLIETFSCFFLFCLPQWANSPRFNNLWTVLQFRSTLIVNLNLFLFLVWAYLFGLSYFTNQYYHFFAYLCHLFYLAILCNRGILLPLYIPHFSLASLLVKKNSNTEQTKHAERKTSSWPNRKQSD